MTKALQSISCGESPPPGALDRHSKSAHMGAFRQVSAALRADPAVRTYTRIA